MPILIDGHNLIGRLPAISLQDPDDEEKLARMLSSYRARTGKSITVVFDPGGEFLYNSGDTNILGEIVRRTSGSSTLTDFADRYLFQPLGIESYCSIVPPAPMTTKSGHPLRS